ncbi:hypothetical protein SARC_04175 [Sphaeroforma arctica JP610]|uniref:Rad60/SUMO-like domain-containing protein n=1 Tax=Sphaeroforma arctica JP610 TaxID=667725 RepID=A0A0L0G3B5_9EUKA|nr:hypothetical protein SARC_04175 [Sphaeroforma arctica JP610]KNC83592.1 hypothetical protein SARC_04175 [Sphaeroforma arctica JP610]|eukprot:XP_014157494.1 hypothetical protein SARC_04175 [Sphaeroforma arctica JP610]
MASPTAPAHRYISLSDTAQSSLSSPSPSQQPLAVSYTTQLNQGALVTRRFRVQVGEKAYYRHADLFMEVTRVLAATTGLSSHECRSLAFEMYRGLVCRAVYGEKGGDLSLLSFPSRVDKAWQFAILNTRLYVDFCADVFGEYVHYSTADVGDVDEADRDARVQRALAQYTQVWSEHPPLSLWTPFTEVAGASSIPDASGGVTGTQRNHVLVPDVEVRPHASVVDKKGPKRRDRGADQDNSEDEPLNKLLGQDAKSKPDRGRPKKFLRGPKVSQQSQQYNDVRQSDVAHGPNVVPDTNSGLDPSGTQALEGNNLNAQDNATMKAIYDQQLGPKQSAANGIVSTTKPPKLEFKVSNERGEFVRFNVSPNTRLEKVMTAYCNLNGLEPGTVVFVMRESGSESNISGDDTVRSLDLEGKTVYIQTR